MTMQRHLKPTPVAGAATISLPAKFALSSDDAVVRKEDDRLIGEPEITRNRQVNGALLAWLATQEPLPPEDTPDPAARDGLTRPVTDQFAATVIDHSGDEVTKAPGVAS